MSQTEQILTVMFQMNEMNIHLADGEFTLLSMFKMTSREGKAEFRERFPLRVLTYRMKQDDPRKCSSAKLAHFGLVKPVFRTSEIPSKAIVLNPKANIVICPSDRKLALLGGLVSIDCSWDKVDEVFAARSKRGFPGVNLRLPMLLAGNPVNYGRLAKLSSAEALSASLRILGFREYSERLLSIFKWGDSFLALNRDPLDEYSKARSREEMLVIEKSYF